MILYDFIKSLSHFFVPKNDSSLYKGAFGGQGRALSLRCVVVCFVSFATAFGCLSFTTQLLLFRKNHARLACSVVNALSTAHCRYQLLRISDNRKGCPYGMIFHSISYKAKPQLWLSLTAVWLFSLLIIVVFMFNYLVFR